MPTEEEIRANRQSMIEKIRKQKSDLEQQVASSSSAPASTAEGSGQSSVTAGLNWFSGAPNTTSGSSTSVSRDPRRAAASGRHHNFQPSTAGGPKVVSNNPPPPPRPLSHSSSHSSTPPPPPPPGLHMDMGTSASSSQHAAPLSGPQSMRSLAEQQQAALQHANQISDCFFITQNSAYGNLIIPVIPRIDPNAS
ncbi:uncharacterized protein LOC142341679 [Convolutriloba macropyga]|uniref:uncharacterized protein LOC142341679 n=1 Tax=Convolutriloba macropyga TaxID=536237 RepID=UPI003F528133